MNNRTPLRQHVSPFIMLDYAGPARFEPTTARRGVGTHPHKGFEMVTIVYEGEFASGTGPARTFTPINIWDMRLRRDKSVDLNVPEGHTLSILVLSGTVSVNGQEIAREAQTVLPMVDFQSGAFGTMQAKHDQVEE